MNCEQCRLLFPNFSKLWHSLSLLVGKGQKNQMAPGIIKIARDAPKKSKLVEEMLKKLDEDDDEEEAECSSGKNE